MRFFIVAAFLTSSLNSSVSRALDNVADPTKLPHTQDTKRKTLIIGLNKDESSKYLPESKADTETDTPGNQDETRQDGPLLLSPYIKKGKIEDAKQYSRVPFFYETKGVEAFSGFITINEDAQTNYFFLHTKTHVLAQIVQIVRKPPPLILWLSGGPGSSSLMAQFLYNGPVAVDATGRITERVNSLANFADAIYLDQPAGTGFSFAADESGSSQSIEQMSANIMTFLGQFLMIFKEYNGRDFYIAGEACSATQAMHLAYTLHKDRKFSFNLAGVISGVRFLGQASQILNHTDILTDSVVPNTSAKHQLAEACKGTTEVFIENNIMQTQTSSSKAISHSEPNFDESQNEILTAHSVDANTFLERIRQYYVTVNSTDMRRKLHIGDFSPLQEAEELVAAKFETEDPSTYLSCLVEYVMKRHKVLFYFSLFDTVCATTETEGKHFYSTLDQSNKFVEKLNMTIRHTSEDVHRIDVGNTTYALVKYAGQFVSLDKPGVVYKLIKKFVTETKAEPSMVK